MKDWLKQSGKREMKDIKILITLWSGNITNYLILLESLVCKNDKRNLILYIIGQGAGLRFYKEIDFFVKKNDIRNVYFQYPEYDSSDFGKAVVSVIADPHILPDVIGKVLYLNANILVNSEIGGLWDFDMGNAPFAACENRWISRGANLGVLEKAGKKETDIYYSTDVMLLNPCAMKLLLPDWCVEGGCANTLEVFVNKYLSAQIIEIRDHKYNTQLMSYRKVARKEKYTEAVLINYAGMEMKDYEEADEDLYKLWWGYAKKCGIKKRNTMCNVWKIRKGMIYVRCSFNVDFMRFAIRKIMDNRLDFGIFTLVDYFKHYGLWDSFYFLDRRKKEYQKKYKQLIKGYQGVMVYLWPIGGAGTFFLTIICYSILARRDDILYILIPDTLTGRSTKADNPDFYVHNKYVLRYMNNAYIPTRAERDFVRYILSKYYYRWDLSQVSRFMPTIYEDSGGTYEALKDMKIIQFSDDEIARGNQFLQEHNIDGKFVCIVPRSSDYKKEYVLTVGFNDYLPQRNGDIESYLNAVYLIQAAGYHLIQMGKVNRKSFPAECGILKFADVYDEFLDLYLFSKCEFVLGDSSGVMCIASLFSKPQVQANWELITSSKEVMGYLEEGHDLILPVKYWNAEKECFLSLREQLALEAKYRNKRFEEEVIRLGYEGISNSSEEIEMAAKEMIDYILGEKKYTEEEVQLQKVSRELVIKSAQKYGMRYPRCNFAVGFLKLNPWYLEGVT